MNQSLMTIKENHPMINSYLASRCFLTQITKPITKTTISSTFSNNKVKPKSTTEKAEIANLLDLQVMAPPELHWLHDSPKK